MQEYLDNAIVEDMSELCQSVVKVLNHFEVLCLFLTIIVYKVCTSRFFAKFNPSKLYSQLKLYTKLRNVLSVARSFNHQQTLLGKYILGLQIKDNEDEVTTFGDIKKHFGQDFPFFMS